MNKTVILHNPHDADSRAFIEANPTAQVVSWYSEENLLKEYQALGLPSPSTFPSVVDTEIKRIIARPSTLQDAIDAHAAWETDELPRLQATARSLRDTRLLECDWIMSTDCNASVACKAAFQTYRQTLRDLDFSDPLAIIWPSKPAYEKAS